MITALAPLAAALLAAGCSAATGGGDQQSQPAALTAEQLAEDCLGRRDASLGPDRAAARRAALAEAMAPGHQAIISGIAGEQPAWVVDRAEVLSAATERRMAERSQSLEAATTDQLVVVTVPELGGLSTEEFALSLGNKWGMGRGDADNGVILLVAPSERRVRIEVGCGLEAVLTDARAAEIVARMTPLFRRGDFEQGVTAGWDDIEGTLRSRPERRRAL